MQLCNELKRDLGSKYCHQISLPQSPVRLRSNSEIRHPGSVDFDQPYDGVPVVTVVVTVAVGGVVMVMLVDVAVVVNVRVMVRDTIEVCTFDAVVVAATGWVIKQLQALVIKAELVPAGLK